MYSTLLTSALFATILALQAVADFTVNTPKLKQCQTSTIEWAGDKGQVLVSVVKANDPCGNALVDLPNEDGSSLQWKVTLPAGTKVQVAVEDDSDDVAWSGIITVEPSDDDSCLDGNDDDNDEPKGGNKSSKSVSAKSAAGTSASVGGSQPAIVPAAATAGAAPVTTPAAVTPNGGLGANNVGSLGTSSGALTQMRVPALWLSLASAVLIAAVAL